MLQIVNNFVTKINRIVRILCVTMVNNYDKITSENREGKPGEKPARERETMKNMYVCEKCGKMSENYEEIEKCERMHYVMPRPWEEVEGLNATLDSMTEYKEGQEEPNVIHVMFERGFWDEDGEYKTERRCGKYKLVSSYEMPLVIENK